MDRKEILDFLNQHPLCHLATTEGMQPRVRGMMMYKADAQGVVFHTGKDKALCRQLSENGRAEACFNDLEKGVQVRVSGRAEVLTDLALKKEIVAARPFMQPWVEKQGYDLLVIFRLVECRVAVWTMADNFAPTTYQDL